MEIEGHIIKDAEIIGIGPLMSKKSDAQIDRQIYNSTKLLFDIHLKERSVSIETNFLHVGYGNDGLTEEEKKARQEWKDFTAKYQEVKKVIADLISTNQQPTKKTSLTIDLENAIDKMEDSTAHAVHLVNEWKKAEAGHQHISKVEFCEDNKCTVQNLNYYLTLDKRWGIEYINQVAKEHF